MRMHDWVMVEAIGQFPRPEERGRGLELAEHKTAWVPRPEQRGRGVELGEYEDAGLGDGGSNRGRYH